MNSSDRMALIIVAIYVLVLAILLGVLKGIFKEADEKKERLQREYRSGIYPGDIEGSSDYIMFVIWWPVCVALLPLYGLFRFAKWITIKIKNNDRTAIQQGRGNQ